MKVVNVEPVCFLNCDCVLQLDEKGKQCLKIEQRNQEGLATAMLKVRELLIFLLSLGQWRCDKRGSQ